MEPSLVSSVYPTNASLGATNFYSMERIAPPLRAVCLTLAALELCTHFACLPVSALNGWLIARSGLLHRNLKFLLLCQCLVIALMSLVRTVVLVPALAHADLFFGNGLIRFLYFPVFLSSIIFVDWLGFALLFERILATVFCSSYEQDRHPNFIVACALSLAIVTVCCYASVVDQHAFGSVSKAVSTRYEIFAFLWLSFACIGAAVWTLRYNKRRYAELAAKKGGQHLSERYQICENIRTILQLIPCAVFHCLEAMLTLALVLLSYFDVITASTGLYALTLNSVFTLFALANIAIQISVITMHPMLNRRARRFLTAAKIALWISNRVSHRTPDGDGDHGARTLPDSHSAAHHGEVPLNIMGAELCPHNTEMEQYFRVLDQFWK